MTIAGLLKAVIDNPDTQVQYLNDCLISAKATKNKKGGGYTKVEFGTVNYSPGDVINHQTSQYVGMIVWIPRDEYDKLQGAE